MGNNKLRIIHLEASNYGDHMALTSVVDPDPEQVGSGTFLARSDPTKNTTDMKKSA
jgi:hypothetical protein